MPNIISEYPQFFTASIQGFRKLLKPDRYKDIVVNSMRFLVEEERVRLFAFVIMWNHLHLIWQMMAEVQQGDVQRDFLKFTAQQLKEDLRVRYPRVLEQFRVKASDREYHFWKRRSLSIELRSLWVFRQKLDYIHRNPVKAGICRYPEDYKYSSASFYESGIDNWGFLTHYRD